MVAQAPMRDRAATARSSVAGRRRAGIGILLLLLSSPGMAAETPATRSARGQGLWQAYQQQRYRLVSQQAPVYLKNEQPDEELRLAIANSFAWSGNYAEAIWHYEALDGSGYTREALLGRANVYRWSGRAALSVPLYQRFLEQDPHDAHAREGLILAEREISPRTMYRKGRMRDSDGVVRPWQTVSQRWRSRDSLEIYEVEAGDEHDRRNELNEVHQRDVLFRYENLKLPLQPWLEVSRQALPTSEIFGLARFTLDDRPTRVYIGRINWGKLAFTPEALSGELTADRYGIESAFQNSLGQWRLAYDYFAISDNNTIREPSARYTPAWQPFPGHSMRWFMGISERTATRNVTQYWSPEKGYRVMEIGIEAEWNTSRYDISWSVSRGYRLAGEARDTWSAAAALKRWFGHWAFGIEGRATSGWREDAAYRLRTWTASVEKRW